MSDQQAAFNEAATSVSKYLKIDDVVLRYTTTASSDLVHYYDFVSRMMVLRIQSKESTHLVHFRDIDPETLSFMRDKLVELGGKPPALPTVRDPFNPVKKGM